MENATKVVRELNPMPGAHITEVFNDCQKIFKLQDEYDAFNPTVASSCRSEFNEIKQKYNFPDYDACKELRELRIYDLTAFKNLAKTKYDTFLLNSEIRLAPDGYLFTYGILRKDKPQLSISEKIDELYFNFNGIDIYVDRNSDVEKLEIDRGNAYSLGLTEIGPREIEYTPEILQKNEEYKIKMERERQERQKQYEKELRIKKRNLTKNIKGIEFKVIADNQEDYNKIKEDTLKFDSNRAIVTFAENWAKLIINSTTTESGIDFSKFENKDFIENLSFQADIEGLSGSMFSAAKKLLIEYWEYGEQLAKAYEQKVEIPSLN